MSTTTFAFKLTGATPLILHADNVSWSDQMDRWQKDPHNSKMSKAGDDRTPAWRWIGSLVHDGEKVSIPSEYLSRALMGAGAMIRTGKGQKTFKSDTQSGMMIVEPFLPLSINNNGGVPWKKIEALKSETQFDEIMKKVEALGFELDVRRLKVGMSKHVRVRPRFNKWSCSGTISVIDPRIDDKVIGQLFELAGKYRGLGDERPGGPTPGPYGRFDAEVRNVG